MKKISLSKAIIFAHFFLGMTLTAVAADELTVAPVTVQKPATAMPAAVSTVNIITRAAVNAGVLACTSRINQVSNFLTAGSQGTGAVLFISPAAPDQELVSVSMEIPMTNAPSVYASASFAPNQVNNCGSLYESVAYWPAMCSEVAEKNFGKFKQTGILAKSVTMLDGGEFVKIFLLPAGSGCVSIKKEIVL